MESIEVGCPVIAYDVRYGPSEIINHGVNGYLVEPDNIKAFADCMAKIIDEPFNNVQTRPELSHDKAVENYKNYFKTSGILNNKIFLSLYHILISMFLLHILQNKTYTKKQLSLLNQSSVTVFILLLSI